MAEKVLMKGNEALAEAAIRCGCKRFFGYPITPQTEVAAYMAKRLPKIGGTYMQAESEISAINMVYGAASAGVRAMTSSSSPGISLKTEGISYLIGSDLPCLIINVMRGGPGLGGIQPSQSDYWQATKAPGHGDGHILVFAPSTIQEMVDLVFDAFDLAETYRMPAMILADGMLGQMMEPVVFPEKEVVEHEKPWAANGHQGKREHNIINSLYLKPDELERTNRERFARYEIIKEKEARVEEYLTEDADIIVVAYGATSRIVRAAVKAAREQGIKAGMVRPITVWPFPAKAVAKAAETASRMLCVEMSLGQMVEDVRLAVNGKVPVEFYGRTGGIIPTPAEVLEQIKKIAGGAK
ncbi:3-methyl-2-oxobutanoate dehydrogenase subunit VorB [Clostridiaceae bacterium NSJ-31]|uniref:3-methyl-2-oxobutanoate dehydrogenase subunit VorB n=1 Tax=Ligaoa zhengdingensis TaxID=2763658 RepID=A0A926DUB7_9FIRM|nr:3-methyl-2-oxobutanoate dehydrogenase subunit VorB [Ligaoa zhengdingensis]MBC8545425.1 3-methyl-2-oxobutanoate dehydrogenase subunit VorB [Ligaoa zhengdingensis]